MKAMKLPSAPDIKTISIDGFLGCDLTQKGANVYLRRSQNCPNIIRESKGKVRRRTGYTTNKTYPAKINGVFQYKDGTYEKQIIHAGTKLYLDFDTDDYTDDTILYSACTNDFSKAMQLNKKLCIVDGTKMLLYGKHDGTNYTIDAAENRAKIPEVVIGRGADGGGTSYEPINLIGKKQTNCFCVKTADASKTAFQLTADSLDAATVTAKLMNSDGDWVDKTENTHFTVNRETGVVTFTTAPGETPKEGEDNIKITFSKTISGYADKINKCKILTLYGVNGGRDRLFVSGNPDHPNYDWWSEMNDPTYFGDTWFNIIGQDNSAIVSYNIVNDKLVTILDRADDDTVIYFRQSQMDEDGNVSFVLCGSYQGNGAISSFASGTLLTEPVYLASDGLYAITTSDVLGERYSQERSYYLRGKLAEMDLTKAYGAKYKDYYLFCAGEYIFLVDGLQPITEKELPYSSHQYECYYWKNINARIVWEKDGVLFFGTESGKVCSFATDYDKCNSYNDDEAAIECYWDIPILYGSSPATKKNYRKINLLLGAGAITSVKVSALYDGYQEVVYDGETNFGYFSFKNLQFSKLTFKCDKNPQNIEIPITISPENRFMAIRLENSNINQQFALYQSEILLTERR